MSVCAHSRCSAVGPFGSRWYKGRQEWVPYKLCIDCRNRQRGVYERYGNTYRETQKKPERRKRERELANDATRKERKMTARHEWANTEGGRAVLQGIEKRRGAKIRASTGLRLEATVVASIRTRLAGGRHGESLNIANYTDFESVDDMFDHFQQELKPGMTMENYGTYWSVAHKIPQFHYDFENDPDEIRRCNSRANLGCDYDVWPNPLNEPTNRSKGDRLPTDAELATIDRSVWPKKFGDGLTQAKRIAFRGIR